MKLQTVSKPTLISTPTPVNSVDNHFKRTGRPFGGVLNDIKQRSSFYLDDIKTAFNFQCLTTTFFVFFVNFAIVMAIGELLNEHTDGYLGVSEILIAHAICGTLWGLFSGQPLCIVAASGPFLIFESSLFSFCNRFALNYLATRFWTGFWSFIFLVLMAMFEAPFFMKYITRFTEDIFVAIISTIFIVASLKFIIAQFRAEPMTEMLLECFPIQNQVSNDSDFSEYSDKVGMANSTMVEHCKKLEEIYEHQSYESLNVALMTCLFFLATFILACLFRKLRMGSCCGRNIRRAVADFGLPLSIVFVTACSEFSYGSKFLQRVSTKPEIDLTSPEKRSWLINPLGDHENPLALWTIPLAMIPGLFASILFYMEVEIVEALLAKKERGLQKPFGFHLDLIISGVLAMVCSTFGLPWLCPTAVQSLSHVNCLTETKLDADTKKVKVEHVLEQRLTTMAIGILHGIAACFGGILSMIPTATLFGVLLYLGLMCLTGLQFFQRIFLLFIPEKYFPNEDFCKNIIVSRMRSYTMLQFICYLVLFVVKTYPISSLAFPFVLVLIAVFRKTIISMLFSRAELRTLDGKTDLDKNDDDEDVYDQLSNHN